ncbi:MAG: AMP-binding protein [Schwartzia sp.]|nr:AMP-binding protein [Schwartzia sp. (in: firmicutes)]
MTKHLFATILDAFRHNAEARPDHIALVYEDIRLTYGQVDELSDNLAAYIQGRIPPKSVVGIMLGRNKYMMVAPLGVLKAGCAYLPLDPSYPQERLQFMMKDAAFRWCVLGEK